MTSHKIMYLLFCLSMKILKLMHSTVHIIIKIRMKDTYSSNCSTPTHLNLTTFNPFGRIISEKHTKFSNITKQYIQVQVHVHVRTLSLFWLSGTRNTSLMRDTCTVHALSIISTCK